MVFGQRYAELQNWEGSTVWEQCGLLRAQDSTFHPQHLHKERHFSALIPTFRMSWSFLLEQICSVQGPLCFSPLTWWLLMQSGSWGGLWEALCSLVAAVVLQWGLPESQNHEVPHQESITQDGELCRLWLCFSLQCCSCTNSRLAL